MADTKESKSGKNELATVPEQIESVSPPVQQIEVNPQDVREIIDSLPDKERRVMRAFMAERRFSGPLPPPEFMSGYKAVLPDAPERIMRMAEEEQKHRHSIESNVAKTQLRQFGLGQIFGFILAAFFGVICLVLGIKGHTTLAGIIGTTTVIGLATIFVLRQHPKRSDDDEE